MSASPYYPPRAKWYSRSLAPWYALDRHLHLSRIPHALEISPFHLLISLILPGYAWGHFGRRTWAWATVGVWVAGALVFLGTLGTTVSFVAFGLMIAAHVNSVVFLLQKSGIDEDEVNRWLFWLFGAATLLGAAVWMTWHDFEAFWTVILGMFLLLLAGWAITQSLEYYGFGLGRLPARVVLTLAVLFFFIMGVYRPLLDGLEAGWLMPLRVDGKVVIVSRLGQPWAIRRGDFVAYEIPAVSADHGVFAHAGFGFEAVWGWPGETVRFTPEGCEVGGRHYPRKPNMPASGEWSVPEKHGFIWPRVDINRPGQVAQATVDDLLCRLAMVGEDQWIGRPFQSWFGRRQMWP